MLTYEKLSVYQSSVWFLMFSRDLIARRSAMECSAILDACYEYKFLSHTDYKQNKSLLRSIIAMLSKLSRHARYAAFLSLKGNYT